MSKKSSRQLAHIFIADYICPFCKTKISFARNKGSAYIRHSAYCYVCKKRRKFIRAAEKEDENGYLPRNDV